MIRKNLEKLTIEDLLQRFVDGALIQYETILDEDTKTFNRIFDRMVEVEEELKRRGPEARKSLLALYDHDNIQVRLNAAEATAGIAPKRARKLLQEIKDEQEFPQSADAGLGIRMLASGEWKPT
jgi:5'-3' exonuclease